MKRCRKKRYGIMGMILALAKHGARPRRRTEAESYFCMKCLALHIKKTGRI